MLAPIVIFCFNRPNHLRKTIEALASNTLAASSDLYIYSDGPRAESDFAAVDAVRQYLQTVSGFRSVTIKSTPKNKGLAKSVIDGVTEVAARYGRVIVLEDDLLTTPDFLSYMNEGLDIFEKNSRVFSVSGYSYGLQELPNYAESTAMVLRASSYGWGTWYDRWSTVDWAVGDFPAFMQDSERKDRLKDAGEDILPMIVKQQRGVIDSWAVRWTYHHVKYDAYCVIPVLTKVKNIGNDGTGSNPVARAMRKPSDLNYSAISFNSTLQPNANVTHFIRTKHRPSLFRRLLNLLRYNVW